MSSFLNYKNNSNNGFNQDNSYYVEESSLKELMSNKIDGNKIKGVNKENPSLYLVSQPMRRIRLNKPFDSKDMWKLGSENLAKTTNERNIRNNNCTKTGAKLLQR